MTLKEIGNRRAAHGRGHQTVTTLTGRVLVMGKGDYAYRFVLGQSSFFRRGYCSAIEAMVALCNEAHRRGLELVEG